MRSLTTELYRAFNPVIEIRGQAWYFSAGQLITFSQQEKLLEGCMINRLLHDNLSDTEYRVLRLYYRQPVLSNYLLAYTDIDCLLPELVRLAKIRSVSSPAMRLFIQLCCIDECWQLDTFHKRRCPIQQFSELARVHSKSLMRRKDRLVDNLREIKTHASFQAALILKDCLLMTG